MEERKTDVAAIIAFSAGLGGFIVLPTLFIPIGYISAIVSYFRLKERPELKGRGFRIAGAILTTVNILYVLYAR